MTNKPMKYLGVALGMLTLVASAESVEAQTRTRSGRSRCSRVYVSSAEIASTRRSRPKFSAAEILDIQLKARVSRKLTGNHALEFKIYTPNGNLYQSMKLQFDASQDPQSSASARGSSRYHEVNTLLPVAGTSIVSSSMYGTWKVEAFLDGADQRCSRPRTFIIQP